MARNYTETDEAIRRVCDERGYRFKPADIRPWDVTLDEVCAYPSGTGGAESWPKAQKLRRQLLDELGLEGP